MKRFMFYHHRYEVPHRRYRHQLAGVPVAVLGVYAVTHGEVDKYIIKVNR